jgi:hypothetical protein
MGLTEVIKGAFAHGDYALAERAAEVSCRRYGADDGTKMLLAMSRAIRVVVGNHELYDTFYLLKEPKLRASEFERFATRRELLSDGESLLEDYEVILDGARAGGVDLPQRVHDQYAALQERVDSLRSK